VALVPLSSVDGSPLRWLRTGDSPPSFTLSAETQAVAELRFAKTSGSLARASASEGDWTLKRSGFLLSHLTLRVEGAPSDTARITLHADIRADILGEAITAGRIGDNYHRIDFTDGAKFRFSRSGVQTPSWKVRTEAGVEVAHIEPVREGRRLTSGAVVVSPEGIAEPKLVSVLVFAWYFIVLAWFEDEILAPVGRVLSDLERR
jgi:hypothetical protein